MEMLVRELAVDWVSEQVVFCKNNGSPSPNIESEHWTRRIHKFRALFHLRWKCLAPSNVRSEFCFLSVGGRLSGGRNSAALCAATRQARHLTIKIGRASC